jgi:hypothetical protein
MNVRDLPKRQGDAGWDGKEKEEAGRKQDVPIWKIAEGRADWRGGQRQMEVTTSHSITADSGSPRLALSVHLDWGATLV